MPPDQLNSTDSDQNLDVMVDQVVEIFRRGMNQLHDVWQDIGLSKDQCVDREVAVVNHIGMLISEMVTEEKDTRRKLTQNIENVTKDLIQISKDLCIPLYSPNGDLTLLELEKDLLRVISGLKEEKDQRLDALRKLQEEEEILSQRICCPTHPQPAGPIPTENELKELESNIDYLRSETNKRKQIFVQSKKEIIAMLVTMDSTPNSQFAREVVCEDDDVFVLSSDNMLALKDYKLHLEQVMEETDKKIKTLTDKLQLLWERLNTEEGVQQEFLQKLKSVGKTTVVNLLEREITQCQMLKQQNIGRFVEKLREELVSWQDRCYISHEERQSFTAFSSTNYTEELLETHEREVARLQDYYNENRDMITKVSRREGVWKKMLEFEVKARNPSRLDNRGGKLLLEEKERKSLTKELPKLDKDLEHLVKQWELEHGRDFIVNGKSYLQYVQQLWDVYNMEKENERLNRQRAKLEKVDDKVLNRSKPLSAAQQATKRHLQSSRQSPMKMRKIDVTVSPMKTRAPHSGITVRTPTHSKH